jgi:hypothetical protein
MSYRSGTNIVQEVFDAVPEERMDRLDEKAQNPDETVTETIAMSAFDNKAFIIETNEDKTEATMEGITPSGLSEPSEKSIPELNKDFRIGSLNPLPADEGIADTVRASAYHERERSQTARRVDENRQNSNTTTDFETWKENPGQFDFPGVDTADGGFRF